MLKHRYAKNTYGPKCQNTHGPKLWLLDTLAWAHGPGSMGRRRRAAAAGEGLGGGGGAARRPGGGGPCAQGHGPMPMCPGAKPVF